MWWPFRRAGHYSLYDVAWDTRQILLALHRKVDRMASTEQDLQNDLDLIKGGVATVVEKLNAQSKVIEDLRGQVGTGTPVTQGQLDALKSEADGITAVLAPLVTGQVPATSSDPVGSAEPPTTPPPATQPF